MKNYAKELMERGLAEQSLLINIMYMEAFEVAARSAAILSNELLEVNRQLAAYAAEDSHHLKILTEKVSEGWVCEELVYSLQKVLRSGSPLLAELAHITIVEPALQVLAQTNIHLHDVMKKIAGEESSHLKLAEFLGRAVERLDKKFAEFVEENGLLLYSTVFSTEEGKAMLSTTIGETSKAEEELKKLYQRVDGLRTAIAEKMFGANSETLKIVKGYGLARTGLC